MNVVLHANDKLETMDIANVGNNIKERLAAGPKRTKIVIKNADTGEVLGVRENKVVITGGMLNAMDAWGLSKTVDIPTYNSEMNLDNTETGVTAKNTPIICLFCVSDSGCGTTPKDIYVANYIDRIKPAPKTATKASDFTSEMIMPFRWVDDTNDLSADLRNYYFGRKTYSSLGKIGYYFKSFDTTPQLHLIYSDGTPITSDIYNNESDQAAECYVETRLRITRLDFRDYFEDILGWDKARISSLSLIYGWYDDTIDKYKWYQDTMPYSKLNFSYLNLTDTTLAVDFEYSVYY